MSKIQKKIIGASFLLAIVLVGIISTGVLTQTFKCGGGDWSPGTGHYCDLWEYYKFEIIYLVMGFILLIKISLRDETKVWDKLFLILFLVSIAFWFVDYYNSAILEALSHIF